MPDLLPFELYPETINDRDHQAVAAHVTAGLLPPDTLFRFASIGYAELDPRQRTSRLGWALLQDAIEHAEDWNRMRPHTRTLLEGPLPDAVISIWPNYETYPLLDTMYYGLRDAARAIRDYRADTGQTITEIPPFSPYDDVAEAEARRCFALARPLWRTIIERIHPEWLDQPRLYWPPTVSFNQVYYPSNRTAARRIVGAAVISDSVVLDIYNEAKKNGVKRIGPAGQETLRRLLLEEHLELSEDFAFTPDGGLSEPARQST